MKKKRLIFALVVAMVIAGGLSMWWRLSLSEEYQRRKYFPMPVGDGCQLLDQTLGSHARDPAALIDVFSWRFKDGPNPHGLVFPDFFDVQHQALIRLLDLQLPLFGSKVSPPAGSGLKIDHSYAVLRSRNDSVIVVEGTPTLRPTAWDLRPWEGYWQAETLRLTPEGRLISREAVAP